MTLIVCLATAADHHAADTAAYRARIVADLAKFAAEMVVTVAEITSDVTSKRVMLPCARVYHVARIAYLTAVINNLTADLAESY